MFLKLSISGPLVLDNSSVHHFLSCHTGTGTGTFRNLEILLVISMFCNNEVAKVLRELFAFVHHDMFLVQLPNEILFYTPSAGTDLSDINLQ